VRIYQGTARHCFVVLALLLAMPAMGAPAAAKPEAPANQPDVASGAAATAGTVESRLSASGLSAKDIATTFAFEMNPASIRLISLREVILETLANNLDLQITRLDRAVADDEIQIQMGIYDPMLSAQVSRTRIDQQNSNQPVSVGGFTISDITQRNTDLFQTGISQLTPLGSVFELSLQESNTQVMDASRSGVLNPFIEQRATLGARQPLLKNFGPLVTDAGIRISKLEREAARQNLMAEINKRVSEVMSAYWDLVFAVENLSVNQIFLKQARDLLRINTIKYDTGVLSITDVLQAKAQVAAGEVQVTEAQSTIIAAQDRLKQLMNLERSRTEWNRPIIPEDLARFAEMEAADESVIEEALERRPEVLAFREYLKIAQLNRDVTHHQKLPELNLFGEFGVSGAGESSGQANDVVRDYEYNNYGVGLEFKYPILNRKARFEYEKALKSLQKTEKQLENLELGITLESRTALRQLRTNRKQIDANRTAVESEEAKLNSELKRFDVGMATSFEVLTFQKDLANARVGYISSVVNYNKSRIELERVRARIPEVLEGMGIPLVLDPAPPSPAQAPDAKQNPSAQKTPANSGK